MSSRLFLSPSLQQARTSWGRSILAFEMTLMTLIHAIESLRARERNHFEVNPEAALPLFKACPDPS
jgi:hypothetical protein